MADETHTRTLESLLLVIESLKQEICRLENENYDLREEIRSLEQKLQTEYFN